VGDPSRARVLGLAWLNLFFFTLLPHPCPERLNALPLGQFLVHVNMALVGQPLAAQRRRHRHPTFDGKAPAWPPLSFPLPPPVRLSLPLLVAALASPSL
jgi:hypothetical protein